jgi:hypothetical protein
MSVQTHSVQRSASWYNALTAHTRNLAGERPLKALQQSDIYFSTQSTRAQIDRMLDTPGQNSLLFHLTPSDALPVSANASHMALLVQKLPVPASEVRRKKGASVLNNTPPDHPVHMEWLRFRPVQNPALYLYPLTASAAAASNAAATDQFVTQRIPEKAVAFSAQTGELIPLPDNKQDASPPTPYPIEERHHPLREKIFHWFRERLPNGRLGPIELLADGTLRILNRWEFNPIRYWVNQRGNKVERLLLADLTPKLRVNILEKQSIGTFPSSEGAFRKALRERIVQEIETVEQKGYQLIKSAESVGSSTTPSTPVADPAPQSPEGTGEAIAQSTEPPKPTIKGETVGMTGLKAGATNPFRIRVSSQFQPIADGLPASPADTPKPAAKKTTKSTAKTTTKKSTSRTSTTQTTAKSTGTKRTTKKSTTPPEA